MNSKIYSMILILLSFSIYSQNINLQESDKVFEPARVRQEGLTDFPILLG